MDTHALVPELSVSKYLWTSKINPVVVPSGFLTVLSAAADPLETKVSAEVQLLPGRRMSWVLALFIKGTAISFFYSDFDASDDLPCVPDRSDGDLNSLGPAIDIGNIMGLVHAVIIVLRG